MLEYKKISIRKVIVTQVSFGELKPTIPKTISNKIKEVNYKNISIKKKKKKKSR